MINLVKSNSQFTYFNNVVPGRFVLEATVVLSTILAIQFTSGAYHRDFASHPDEAAHFVTGVMVHDYLTTAFGRSPMKFAEDYYLQYPKVALGHWPPGFYGVQGLWYLVAGVSKTSATVLIGLIVAATSWFLYRRVSKLSGIPIALVTIGVFLGQGLVRSHTFLIVSDMAVSLFSLLAVFSFSDFLNSQRGRHAALFVLWASIAILTKPVGLALVPFVAIFIVVAGRISILGNWRFWTAVATVTVLCAPWYIWTLTQGIGLHGHADVGHMVKASLQSGRQLRASDSWPLVTSWWVPVVSLPACILAIPRRHQTSAVDTENRIDICASIAWCGAMFLFLEAAPIYPSPRYFLPALAGLMILYSGGLVLLLRWMPGPKWLVWTLIGVLGIFSVVTTPGSMPVTFTGYSVAANSVPVKPGQVMLVSSNSPGEGAFVVERLLLDRRRSEFILRASKVLAKDGWSGGGYQTRFSTGDQVREFLNSVPVHYVVISDLDWVWNFRRGVTQQYSPYSQHHHRLLKAVLDDSMLQFPLVGTFSVESPDRVNNDVVRIYENRGAQHRSPVGFELDMGTSLGRTLRLHQTNGAHQKR